MNANVNTLSSMTVSSSHAFKHNTAGLIPFPTRRAPRKAELTGWVCNVSKHYAFSQAQADYLQVKASQQHTQFDLICKLIDADTCRVIYFDEHLTAIQLVKLKECLMHSRTELIHAKMAYLFAQKPSTLHA